MLKANRLLLLLLLLLSFTLAGCKGETKENVVKDNSSQAKHDAVGESLKNHGQGKRLYENEPRWVTAQGGLKMRKNFSLNSEVILVIPEGEMVTINAELPDEEEVAGVKGKWSRVEYLRETGWVFGGFLTAEDPEQEGIVDESLLIGAWYREDEDGILFIRFLNNNVFETNSGYGLRKGSWSYNSNSSVIKIIIPVGEYSKKVLSLNKEKLEVLYLDSGDTSILTRVTSADKIKDLENYKE